MDIYRDINEIPSDFNAIVTIGTFDGIHIGHENILESLVSTAGKLNKKSMVITFEPHPRSIVSDKFRMELLSTFEEKMREFERIGVTDVLAVNFTKEFSQIQYDDFITKYIVDSIKAKHVIIGYDHKFGKNRDGDEKKLRNLGIKYGFDVTVVKEITLNNNTVSSTLVRNLIVNGKVKEASELLGRFYSFEGRVVEGAKRGRIMGFPTANIKVESDEKLIPQKGVYAVECMLEGNKEYGMMNIGNRPTFENSENIIIEVHLFDFHKDIYGKEIRVLCLERVRDEKKFESMEELIYQINRDKKKTIQIIGNLVN